MVGTKIDVTPASNCGFLKVQSGFRRLSAREGVFFSKQKQEGESARAHAQQFIINLCACSSGADSKDFARKNAIDQIVFECSLAMYRQSRLTTRKASNKHNRSMETSKVYPHFLLVCTRSLSWVQVIFSRHIPLRRVPAGRHIILV